MLRILGGGALHGLVGALSGKIEAAIGMALDGDYGPVGGMRDRIVAGEAVDVVILSRALVEELAASGHADPDSLRDVGEVATGIAVRDADPDAPCATADDLRETLLAAGGIFCPDPVKATAGIHFAGVLDRLGIRAAVAERVHTYPGGNPAMAALAGCNLDRPVGCTQVTEILGTPGVRLSGLLPPGCDLVTTYTAAVVRGASHPESAKTMIDILASPAVAAARRKAGFDA